MSNLIDELEFQLEYVISDREEHYSSRKQAKEWITQDFAEWLVKKFAEEKFNVR